MSRSDIEPSSVSHFQKNKQLKQHKTEAITPKRQSRTLICKGSRDGSLRDNKVAFISSRVKRFPLLQKLQNVAASMYSCTCNQPRINVQLSYIFQAFIGQDTKRLPQVSMLVLASRNQSHAVLSLVEKYTDLSQLSSPFLPSPKLLLCCVY